MPALHDIQQQMAGAILNGPDHVPHAMFEGSEQRVRMAFAVHANTISHGRLVALEDSCPLTLEFLGGDRFNALSRHYLEEGHASHEALADIGCDFADWLEGQGEAQAALFARYDRAWLESYRAAETEPLRTADLAALDETQLLGLGLAPHPAMRFCQTGPKLSEVLGLDAGTSNILLSRPEADVTTRAIDTVAAAFLRELGEGAALGDIFAKLANNHEQADLLGATIALIDAGALTRANSR